METLLLSVAGSIHIAGAALLALPPPVACAPPPGVFEGLLHPARTTPAAAASAAVL
jgi:hypothetical protein